MYIKSYIPTISTNFNAQQEGESGTHYREIIADILQKILPPQLFSYPPNKEEAEQFNLLLPLVTAIPSQQIQGNISFFVIGKYRFNAFKFFLEMISNWLIPGTCLNIEMIYSADFKMPQIGNDLYSVCEIIIRTTKEQERIQIFRNLPVIENEIKLGFNSSYYAKKILESKGIPADEKTSVIQEHITTLIQKRPNWFDIDLLTEMQNIIPLCRNEFKNSRHTKHLSKIIALHYLFKKELHKNSRDQHQLLLKLFHSKLSLDGEYNNALSIVIGINFTSEKEFFEKKQILKAIVDLIPEAKFVEGSFLINRKSAELISVYYLDIEKEDKDKFTKKEIEILQKHLPISLSECIERSIYPVFMPRNEEEIMRNLISLSNQIKSLKDIPQAMISFEEQTDIHLSFTILVVRIMPPKTSSIQEMFKAKAPQIEYIHDRVKTVGMLKKKYIKEATVFRLLIPKEPFLRLNNSIDLYKARRDVVFKLSSVLGEFRDFNGGLITKQSELLNSLKELLTDGTKYSELLLETFFFSLKPVSMQTVLEPEALKTLFQMFLNSLEESTFENGRYRMRQGSDFIFLLIRTDSAKQALTIKGALEKFNVHSSELAQSSVKIEKIYYEGFIYRCDDPKKQQQFLQEAQDAIYKSCPLKKH